jgi:hypothetical protein
MVRRTSRNREQQLPNIAKSLSLFALAGTLAACGDEANEDSFLSSFGLASKAPVEFAVVPHKPLELPENLAALPPPTPGSRNRTDLTPIEDARVALGGNPNGGVTVQSDAALLAATGARSAPSGIRQVLAEEDALYREGNKGPLLPRWFNKNTEAVIYEDMLLDPTIESLRQRASGRRTPEFPPPSFE